MKFNLKELQADGTDSAEWLFYKWFWINKHSMPQQYETKQAV